MIGFLKYLLFVALWITWLVGGLFLSSVIWRSHGSDAGLIAVGLTIAGLPIITTIIAVKAISKGKEKYKTFKDPTLANEERVARRVYGNH